jgi:GDP-D-mannose 3',5'-epimerase
MTKKVVIVLGDGGFIGGHLVKKLKEKGYWVRGVDIKNDECHNYADDFVLINLTNPN